MALWPPALADASSFCPTENFQVSSITDLLPSVRAHRAIRGSQPVLSHTLKDQEHKNAMSQRSCRAKIFVRPASHQHCTTKATFRMSIPPGKRYPCDRGALWRPLWTAFFSKTSGIFGIFLRRIGFYWSRWRPFLLFYPLPRCPELGGCYGTPIASPDSPCRARRRALA